MNKIYENAPDNSVEDLEIPEGVQSLEELEAEMEDEAKNKRD